MSAWVVKSRRAPSRYSRDARVYGHTTTAMHELSTPAPPPSGRGGGRHPKTNLLKMEKTMKNKKTRFFSKLSCDHSAPRSVFHSDRFWCKASRKRMSGRPRVGVALFGDKHFRGGWMHANDRGSPVFSVKTFLHLGAQDSPPKKSIVEKSKVLWKCYIHRTG